MSVTLFKNFLNVGATVAIGPQGAPTIYIDNTDGNGLRVTWEVTKTNKGAPDTGVLQLYNLSKANIGILENIQTLISSFGFSAVLSFGWEGIMSNLMTGQIYKIITQERTETDIITTIEFGERALSTRDAEGLNLQISNSLWLAAFQAIAAQMYVTLSTQFKTAVANNPIALSNTTINAVFDDDPIKDLNILVSAMGPGYNWTIQDGKLYLLNAGAFSDTTPPQILQPSTGLLSYSTTEAGGLQIEALGNPGIRPGQQVLVYDKNGLQLGGGPLRIETITWTGDTNSGCNMSIIARHPSIYA